MARAFTQTNGLLCLRPAFRHNIAFRHQDIRLMQPDGPFHLVLCRNLAFTYFTDALQRRLLAAIADRLADGGLLVLGAHERLPAHTTGFRPACGALPIWRKAVDQ